MVICSPKPNHAIHTGKKCIAVTIATIATEPSADGEAWGERVGARDKEQECEEGRGERS